MKHEEGHFKDAAGKQIYYQYWLPDGEVKSVLLVVHGLAEHSGRYMNVVNRFVPKGYAVYALDHEGSGKSEGARVYVERFENFVRTVYTYFNMVREWQKDKPVYIVGHSMGGLISTLFLLDHQDELKGAVLSGPAVKKPDEISAAIVFIGRIFSKLFPKLGLIGLDVNAVSRDKAVVEAYINDPLNYTGKTTARLAAELLKGMQRVEAEAASIHLPVLIVQGGSDKLVDPSGAEMLYENISSADKTLKIYPELYHEVFNEPEREQVLDDVEGWLDKH